MVLVGRGRHGAAFAVSRTSRGERGGYFGGPTPATRGMTKSEINTLVKQATSREKQRLINKYGKNVEKYINTKNIEAQVKKQVLAGSIRKATDIPTKAHIPTKLQLSEKRVFKKDVHRAFEIKAGAGQKATKSEIERLRSALGEEIYKKEARRIQKTELTQKYKSTAFQVEGKVYFGEAAAEKYIQLKEAGRLEKVIQQEQVRLRKIEASRIAAEKAALKAEQQRLKREEERKRYFRELSGVKLPFTEIQTPPTGEVTKLEPVSLVPSESKKELALSSIASPVGIPLGYKITDFQIIPTIREGRVIGETKYKVQEILPDVSDLPETSREYFLGKVPIIGGLQESAYQKLREIEFERRRALLKTTKPAEIEAINIAAKEAIERTRKLSLDVVKFQKEKPKEDLTGLEKLQKLAREPIFTITPEKGFRYKEEMIMGVSPRRIRALDLPIIDVDVSPVGQTLTTAGFIAPAIAAGVVSAGTATGTVLTTGKIAAQFSALDIVGTKIYEKTQEPALALGAGIVAGKLTGVGIQKAYGKISPLKVQPTKIVSKRLTTEYPKFKVTQVTEAGARVSAQLGVVAGDKASILKVGIPTKPVPINVKLQNVFGTKTVKYYKPKGVFVSSPVGIGKQMGLKLGEFYEPVGYGLKIVDKPISVGLKAKPAPLEQLQFFGTAIKGTERGTLSTLFGKLKTRITKKPQPLTRYEKEFIAARGVASKKLTVGKMIAEKQPFQIVRDITGVSVGKPISAQRMQGFVRITPAAKAKILETVPPKSQRFSLDTSTLLDKRTLRFVSGVEKSTLKTRIGDFPRITRFTETISRKIGLPSKLKVFSIKPSKPAYKPITFDTSTGQLLIKKTVGDLKPVITTKALQQSALQTPQVKTSAVFTLPRLTSKQVLKAMTPQEKIVSSAVKKQQIVIPEAVSLVKPEVKILQDYRKKTAQAQQRQQVQLLELKPITRKQLVPLQRRQTLTMQQQIQKQVLGTTQLQYQQQPVLTPLVRQVTTPSQPSVVAGGIIPAPPYDLFGGFALPFLPLIGTGGTPPYYGYQVYTAEKKIQPLPYPGEALLGVLGVGINNKNNNKRKKRK